MYRIGYAIEDAWRELKSWLPLFAGIAVIVVVVFVILMALFSWAGNGYGYDAAVGACYAHGYPEVKRATTDSPWYCVRRIDGTDEVTPLCDLEKCEGSE